VPLKENADAAAERRRASSASSSSAGPATTSRGTTAATSGGTTSSRRARRVRARAHGRRGHALPPPHLRVRRRKPKGVQHTSAGYLLHAAVTHKWIFDIHDDTIWWCARTVGWVTATATSSTGRSRTERRASSTRATPPIPTGTATGDRRALQGQLVLHGADPHPLFREDGRRLPRAARPLVSPPARHRRRADQPGGLGLVLEGDRPGALPGRRHVVADETGGILITRCPASPPSSPARRPFRSPGSSPRSWTSTGNPFRRVRADS
jgi:hypothetical protein